MKKLLADNFEIKKNDWEDYFSGHCIECYIEESGIFSVNGLAG